MEKRSVDNRSSKRVKVSEIPEEENAKSPQENPTVRLRLLKQLTLNYTGPVTGTLYVFPGIGSMCDVDANDATIMLQKKGNKACCPGSVGPQPYFEIVR